MAALSSSEDDLVRDLGLLDLLGDLVGELSLDWGVVVLLLLSVDGLLGLPLWRGDVFPGLNSVAGLMIWAVKQRANSPKRVEFTPCLKPYILL